MRARTEKAPWLPTRPYTAPTPKACPGKAAERSVTVSPTRHGDELVPTRTMPPGDTVAGVAPRWMFAADAEPATAAAHNAASPTPDAFLITPLPGHS
jgi:hypothetical protein